VAGILIQNGMKTRKQIVNTLYCNISRMMLVSHSHFFFFHLIYRLKALQTLKGQNTQTLILVRALKPRISQDFKDNPLPFFHAEVL
jgi:hypothetical protein